MSTMMRSDELPNGQLEGVRARLSKYNEALKKKHEPLKKESLVVGTLDEDKKDIQRYLSPKKSLKDKLRMAVVQVGTINQMLSTFENLAAKARSQEERDRQEREAKDELRVLLGSNRFQSKVFTGGSSLASPNHRRESLNATSSLSPAKAFSERNNDGEKATNVAPLSPIPVRSIGFDSVRNQYLAAITVCKPGYSIKKLSDSNTPINKLLLLDKQNRTNDAEKKDYFLELRQAWDKYEIMAQNKPDAKSEKESKINEQVKAAENAVVDDWVDYAKAVVEAVAEKKAEKEDTDCDDEDEDDDLSYWIKEAKRLKAEAEARRIAKEEILKRQAIDAAEAEAAAEEEYWLQEAMRLKELNKNKKKSSKSDGQDANSDDVATGEELLNPYDDESVDVLAIAAAARKAKADAKTDARLRLDLTLAKGGDTANNSVSSGKKPRAPWIKTNLSSISNPTSSGLSIPLDVPLHCEDDKEVEDQNDVVEFGKSQTDDGVDFQYQSTHEEIGNEATDTQSNSSKKLYSQQNVIQKAKMKKIVDDDDDSSSTPKDKIKKKIALNNNIESESEFESGNEIESENDTEMGKANSLNQDNRSCQKSNQVYDTTLRKENEMSTAQGKTSKKLLADESDSENVGVNATKASDDVFRKVLVTDSSNEDHGGEQGTKELNRRQTNSRKTVLENESESEADIIGKKKKSVVTSSSESSETCDSEEETPNNQRLSRAIARGVVGKENKSTITGGKGNRRSSTTSNGKSLYDDDSDYEYEPSSARKDTKEESRVAKKIGVGGPRRSITNVTHRGSSSTDNDNSIQPKRRASVTTSSADACGDSLKQNKQKPSAFTRRKKSVTDKQQAVSNSVDDDSDESDCNRNQNNALKGMANYMKKSSSYDTYDDASMSDSIATDDESVRMHQPVIAFHKKKTVEIKEEQQELQHKKLNLDGTYWKYTLNQWANEPAKNVSIDGTQIIMNVPGQTDLWRDTRYKFVKENAPYHFEKMTDDFEVIVHVSGNFTSSYQKAGLMIRSPSDNWLFTGMEFVNGKAYFSTIVTNAASDRCLLPLPLNAENAGIWFCIKRINGLMELYYSLESKKWILSRQCLFATDSATNDVGIVAASPTTNGLDVCFNYYRCSKNAIWTTRTI